MKIIHSIFVLTNRFTLLLLFFLNIRNTIPIKVKRYKTSNQGSLKVKVLKLKCLNIVTPKITTMIIAGNLN